MQYVWKIAALERAKAEGTLTDVVKTAHYTVDATDLDGVTVGAYGSVSFESPDPATMTPYDQLTEAQVVGWVQEKLDVVQIQEQLAQAVEAKRNPPVVVAAPPWAAPVEPVAGTTTTTTTTAA